MSVTLSDGVDLFDDLEGTNIFRTLGEAQVDVSGREPHFLPGLVSA